MEETLAGASEGTTEGEGTTELTQSLSGESESSTAPSEGVLTQCQHTAGTLIEENIPLYVIGQCACGCTTMYTNVRMIVYHDRIELDTEAGVHIILQKVSP
jgi:hypothetical protein